MSRCTGLSLLRLRGPYRHRAGFLLLMLLVVLSLLAGLGMREPVPPDEPRFVLSARQMVESGQWLFPHRGSEIYAEKPPTFMWLQALSYQLVRDWRLAFLLPSLLAALLTLWLSYDLARRLWSQRAARHAVLALFVCLQFGLQAKRGQIDMVLVAMTTASLWALLRYLLHERDWRLLALGGFMAGLGTVTKGVGFLPLLVFVPALALRLKSRSAPSPRSYRGWHGLAAVAGFLAGTGVWLVPMLWAVQASQDPALHAYANEMLWKQTGTRYANAWHHVKPAWYYLQVIATLWLPGALLLPWLLPAWWRRLRRGDPRLILLLGWSALVLLFFSASPGKREVYIFPMLPALCVAAAPLLPALLRRTSVRRVLAGYVAALTLAAMATGVLLLSDSVPASQRLAGQRGIDAAALHELAIWLSMIGCATGAALLWFRLRRIGPGLVVATAALWIFFGVGVTPALNADSSAQVLMQRVGKRIGPDAQLGLLGWREQMLLQADRQAQDFGFKRDWNQQWQQAGPWLQADPQRRWLLVLEQAIASCVDRQQSIPMGTSSRRQWWLVPGTAIAGNCRVASSTVESGSD
jgi:4-amino-4-deoxy-L-arabinose transferase-like glycosyltransferase